MTLLLVRSTLALRKPAAAFLWGLATMLLAGGISGCGPNQTPVKVRAAAALPSDDELRDRLDGIVTDTLTQRELTSETNAAWQILHGTLAYGRNFEIAHESERVPALDWALAGGAMKGWVMQKQADQPGVTAVVEPGSKTGQGHPDQWLAIVAQCDVPSDQPLIVDGQPFEVKDLITQAMNDIYDGKEASWTLIALSHYLDLDSQWKAADDTIWTLERIIAMEAVQDVNTSACGGTHRLSAMAGAVDLWQKAHPGQPLTRGWKAARDKVDECIAKVKEYQQPSGAFSTNFFVDAADSPEISKQLHASGHTLEFLTLSMTDEQLKEPWVVQNVVYLCDLFDATKKVPNLECGALYHAVRGLKLYRQRRFGAREYLPPTPEAESAATAQTSVSTSPLKEDSDATSATSPTTNESTAEESTPESPGAKTNDAGNGNDKTAQQAEAPRETETEATPDQPDATTSNP